MFARELMFAVVSLLAVALIYSSTLTFDVSALMKPVTKITCESLTKAQDVDYKNECCWTERDDGTGGGTAGEEQIVCCRQKRSDNSIDCTEAPTSGPPLPTGDLPQLETVPPIRGLPRGGDVPTLEQVPTEGEPPLPVVCSEEAGLELDEETGQCVPIESPVTDEQPEEPEEEQQQPEEEEEQSEPEEEQSSEESDSGDESNN